MELDETNLSAKQTKAIECLLSELSQEDAAKKAGISRTTLFRWLSEPGFQAVYRQARAQLLETVLTSLQAASVRAVQTLVSVMDDKETQPGARVSAAKCVLDNLLRSREQLEIEERLRVIERRLQQGEIDENTTKNWTN